MSWQVNVEFVGTAAQGFVSVFQPRGLYKVQCAEAAPGKTQNTQKSAILTKAKIAEAYVYGEDQAFHNQSQAYAGQDVQSMFLLEHSSEESQKANEAKLKAALVAYGNATREQAKNVKGNIPVTAANFFNPDGSGKYAWVLLDPPQGDDAYPEQRWISAEEASRLLQGQIKLSPSDWPQSKAAAKAAQKAAQGAATNKAAAMMGGSVGATLPTFGGGSTPATLPTFGGGSAPTQAPTGFGGATATPANGAAAGFAAFTGARG